MLPQSYSWSRNAGHHFSHNTTKMPIVRPGSSIIPVSPGKAPVTCGQRHIQWSKRALLQPRCHVAAPCHCLTPACSMMQLSLLSTSHTIHLFIGKATIQKSPPLDLYFFFHIPFGITFFNHCHLFVKTVHKVIVVHFHI